MFNEFAFISIIFRIRIMISYVLIGLVVRKNKVYDIPKLLSINRLYVFITGCFERQYSHIVDIHTYYIKYFSAI